MKLMETIFKKLYGGRYTCSWNVSCLFEFFSVVVMVLLIVFSCRVVPVRRWTHGEHEKFFSTHENYVWVWTNSKCYKYTYSLGQRITTSTSVKKRMSKWCSKTNWWNVRVHSGDFNLNEWDNWRNNTSTLVTRWRAFKSIHVTGGFRNLRYYKFAMQIAFPMEKIHEDET